MTLPTDTNRRVGKSTALLAEFQSARRTPVDDMSSALNQWVSRFRAEVSPLKVENQYMSSSILNADVERFGKVVFPRGEFTSVATPDTVDRILRSTWGPGATVGADTTYTIQNIVENWLTLAWIENRRTPNLGTLVRVSDVFLPRIVFQAGMGTADIACDWLGEVAEMFTPIPQTIALPAPPMGPVGDTIFGERGFNVFRDPLGVNQEYSADGLELVIDNQGLQSWYMSDGVRVRKRGKMRLQIAMTLRVTDETWTLLQKADADTKESWRIQLEARGATLVIDLKSISLTYDEIGREGLELIQIRVRGEATLDPSGDAVDIVLSR